MGLSIGRIEKEFILTNVCDKELPVRVHGNRLELNALVKGFDTSEIHLVKGDGEAWMEIQPKDSIRIFFSYYGHTMAFETEVKTIENEVLTVVYPKTVVKNLERKFERVPPPMAAKASFVVKGKKIILDFPRSEEYNPATKPEMSGDLDETTIQDLFQEFREKVGKIATENKIVMFRDKKPETFEELLISRFGRTFYIPSTSRTLLRVDRIGQTALVTEEMIRDVLLDQGTSEKNIEIKTQSILAQKRENGIHSEIYCPILFHEYVCGYIYAANTGDKERGLSEDLVEFTDQFSKILAYSLFMHGYFKGSKPVPVEYTADIIDISGSGLLFVHSSKELAAEFVLYADFLLSLQFKNRKMDIQSRIMRRFEEKDIFYYGVLFLEIKPEDFRYLFEYIYGREFTHDDEVNWEGGAPPPSMDLFAEGEG